MEGLVRVCAEVAVADVAKIGHPVAGGEPAPAGMTTDDIARLSNIPPVVADAMPTQSLEFWTWGEASVVVGRRLALLRPVVGLRAGRIDAATR